MKKITVKAPAKINLSLDILGRRADGYHFLRTVMQAIDLCDTIHLSMTSDDIKIICAREDVPCDERNIAYKAAAAFFDQTQAVQTGIRIQIDKIIPSQAGLGGGSADGAAVLVALNELYQTGLDTRKLQEIGALVGADVPFCISGGCALAEGIGEILSPIHAHPEYCLVICKPEVGVSTAAAYKKFDEIGTICPPMTDSLIASLIAGDMKEAALYMSNAFEQLLNMPEVTEIETLLTKHGALKAVMSGSGSAVFGIFDSPLKAEKCFLECKPQYPETYLCHPYNKGATVL